MILSTSQYIIRSMIKIPGRILAFIGRPFYWLLSNIILAIIFGLFLIGRTTRLALTSIVRVLEKASKLGLLKISLFKLKLLSRIKRIKIPKSLRQRVKPLPRLRLSPRLRLRQFIIPAFLLFLLFTFYFLILKDLPSPSELINRQIEVSTKIYDRNSNLLYKIYKDKNRTVIPLSQIPPHVRLATLAAEDAEFYSHPGFSLKGIFRAVSQNLRSGKLQGGSTITQQLVKNALLTPERTLIRKIKEIILSVRVELSFTKDEILEMYLNEVSYGGTAYGIEEASYEYFGKSVKDLSLAEAAFLAGLPQSPTRFSPFGATPELGFARQKEVLHLMRVNKFITENQEEEAENQKLTFVPNKTEIKAPHFVMYVRQLLVEMFGEEMVEKGGLEVMTSLDLPIQELAQKIVREEVGKLKNLKVGNGAALVLNPASGEILAMVGSKDYFDIANDGNVNVTLRERQPGSSIKIVNYAYALANGFNPSTLLDDSPVAFSVPGQPPYAPKNYDGKFKGKIPLRVAFAESRNIPAVKVLASYGVAKMVDLGQKMGITTWDNPSRFGLSLTLGGGEVKLLDLARVYATVANYGKRPEITAILQVKDYKGRVLQAKPKARAEEVLDKRVAYLLIDILKDNHARAGEFGLNSYLVIKNHPEVAVKTGTSNNLRDNLTVGFNQNYLTAVWVGNNDNSPMARIASGVTGASPIWNKIMSALLANTPSIDWKIPEGLVKAFDCAAGRQDWFLEEKKPTKPCPSATPQPTYLPGPQVL